MRPCKFCLVFWFSAALFAGVAYLPISDLIEQKKLEAAEVAAPPVAVDAAPAREVAVKVAPSEKRPSIVVKETVSSVNETTVTLLNETDPNWMTVSDKVRCVFTYSSKDGELRDEHVEQQTEEVGAGQSIEIRFDSRKKCVEEINCSVTLKTSNPPVEEHTVTQEVTRRLPQSGCLESAEVALRSQTKL